MSKKLTPTQLKTLAKEINNKIYSKIDELVEKIEKSKEYIRIETDFDNTKIGKLLLSYYKDIDAIESYIKKEDIGLPTYYLPSRSYSYDNIKKALISQIRNKEFKYPVVSYDSKSFNSVYEQILHELTLNQLTSDIYVTSLINKMISKFLNL